MHSLFIGFGFDLLLIASMGMHAWPVVVKKNSMPYSCTYQIILLTRTSQAWRAQLTKLQRIELWDIQNFAFVSEALEEFGNGSTTERIRS